MSEGIWEEIARRWDDRPGEVRGRAGAGLVAVHPLSGAEGPRRAGGGLAPEPSPTGPMASARERCLREWRDRRVRLARSDPAWAFVPADPARRDRTIWQQLDQEARLLAAGGAPALLSVRLGPVQPFIEAAHTVRDLWTGSFLLAYLTSKAMEPLIDEFGPWSVISPALRGMPLVERRLFGDGSGGPDRAEDGERLLLPCLPNTFLALVPEGRAGELTERCASACRDAWSEIAEAVRRALDDEIRRKIDGGRARGWDRLWEAQIDSYFEVRAAAVPWSGCDAATVERLTGDPPPDLGRLPAAVRDRLGTEDDRLFAGRMAILGGVLDALRSVRHVPAYAGEPDESGYVPAKCTMLGTLEQMGPARLEESRAFWDEVEQKVRIKGTRVRSGEALCAVALVKRFAWPTYFQEEFRQDVGLRRFADTATVAARVWLGDEGDESWIDPEEEQRLGDPWSGQWLHWSRRDEGRDRGERAVPSKTWKRIQDRKREMKCDPPIYYAVLALDGDRMGRWIRGDGEQCLRLGDVVDPEAPGLSEEDRAELARMPRPADPALLAAVSEAATNFSLRLAPKIVSKARGELIYAGGDDVLALLPVKNALACALELRRAFSKDFESDPESGPLLLMGGRATASAGIAVAHYKEDLRYALEAARKAEKAAKAAGRDRLGLTIIRRSGEESSATIGWDLVGRLDELREKFEWARASDRWAYALRRDLPTLEALERDALRAELVRVIKRVEEDSFRTWLGDWAPRFFDDQVEAEARASRDRPVGATFADFVTLCQSASFLARGRDR